MQDPDPRRVTDTAADAAADGAPDDTLAHVHRSTLEGVLKTVHLLGRSRGDVAQTLRTIAAAVVDVLEFGSAAINVTGAGGDLRVEAVVGPPDLASLLGQSSTMADWLAVLDACQPWGRLRFLRHDTDPALVARLASWTPPGQPGSGTDAWHPEDSLFAPLAGPDGALLGVLSVDQPASGRYPDLEQRTLLELFAAEAAGAIGAANERALLRDQEILYRTVFDETPAATVIVDDELRLVAVNGAAARLAGTELRTDTAGLTGTDPRTGTDLRTGIHRTGLLGTPLRDLVHPADADGVLDLCRAALADTGGTGAGRTLVHRLNPEIRAAQATAAPMTPAPVPGRHAGSRRPDSPLWVRTSLSRIDGTVSGSRLVLNLEDVTEDRRVLAEMRHLADHDTLTGLPNRRALAARLDTVLREVGTGAAVALLSCDMDGFKAVNDTFGHLVGDDLLVLATRRLAAAVRPGDLLARLGGDEFVVVAQVEDAAAATRIAERLVRSMASPFRVGAVEAAVSVSVGVAVCDRPGTGADLLLDTADAALYEAKSLGRSRWCLRCVLADAAP